jgi:hypothetical protein
VARILHHAGVDPAPRRADTPWCQLLQAHAASILARDFCTIDTALPQRVYVLSASTREDDMLRRGLLHRGPEAILTGNLTGGTLRGAARRC